MPGMVKEAIGLILDLARNKTTMKDIAAKVNFESLFRALGDKLGSLNFEDLRNNFLQLVSDATSPTRLVPSVKIIPGIESSYLSKTKTQELMENLAFNKELILKVPDKDLSAYKDDSLRLIGDLSEKLKEYIECFDIFTEKKQHFNFFSRNSKVDYNKIWNVRKSMKKLLSEMCALLKSYGEKGCTFEGIEEKIRSGNEKKRQAAKTVLERAIFASAYISVYKEVLSSATSYDKKGNVQEVALSSAFTNFVKSLGDDPLLKATYSMSLNLIADAHGNFNSGPNVPDFDFIKETKGGKLCSMTAEERLGNMTNKTPFEVRNLRAEPPFMGDYTEKILECVEKTQRELNDVINLGSRKSKEPPQQSGESKTFEKDIGNLDINLKILLGDQYKNYVKNFEKQKEVLKTAVNKNLVKQMYTLHSQVEKEYKKINQYREKYFLGSKAKDAPGEKEKFYDFSQLKVNVKSTKTGDDKNYEIASKHDELQKIYGEALGNSTSVNYVSLYIRKAEKFLKACKVWNKERTDYEKWLNDRKTIAKEWLRKAKEHFQYLKSQNSLNDEALKNLKKEYGKLPWFAYTFVKDFKTNVEKAEKFCKLKIEKDGDLVDSEGKSLSG